MDLGAPATTDTARLRELPEYRWVQPIHDDRVLGTGAPAPDPAELAAQRDTVRLAFVAALQRLPPRQRAVLILREVLHWQASEVAALLDTTTASVNSALQRARATLDGAETVSDESGLDAEDRDLLDRYVESFESFDIDRLVSLLRDDASFSMPPHDLWIQGPEEVRRWMLGPGIHCRGGRLVATRANGGPAFGSYRVDPEGGWSAWSLQVLELKRGRIVSIHNYLNTELLSEFGLPLHLDA